MTQENNIKILRAIAITAVVLYHISDEIFPNGYMGVDIFFIISGYLLLPKIVNLNLKNAINLYVNRLKRIYPGLISAGILFGLIIYLITDINNKNIIIKSLLGLSNIYYFKNTNYFSESSQIQPFLHFWSLSVELQFYALLPLIGYLFYKSKYALLIILILSFFYYITKNSDGAGFYLLQARIWEFAIGGYIAIYSNKKYKLKNAINILIILFILLILFGGRNNLNIYILVFLTILLIKSQDFYTLKFFLLENISKNSYSTYLVHVPTIYIYKIFFGNQLNFKSGLTLFLFINIIGFIFYKLFEKPKNFKIYTINIAISILAISSLTLLRLDNEVLKNIKMPDYMNFGHNKCDDYNKLSQDFSCLTTNKEAKYLIVGDSHALSLYNGIINSTENIMLIAGHGCLMLPEIKTYNSYNKQDTKNCEYIDEYVKYIRNKNKSIDKLIIVMRNNFYFKNSHNNNGYYFVKENEKNISDIEIYAESLSKLIRLNNDIKVYFVLDWPEINKFPIFCLYNQCGIDYDIYLENLNELKIVVDKLQRNYHNFKTISVDDSFCALNYCKLKKDDMIMQFDYDHLSYYGSKVVLNSILKKIE